jgi:hypothetical protein
MFYINKSFSGCFFIYVFLKNNTRQKQEKTTTKNKTNQPMPRSLTNGRCAWRDEDEKHAAPVALLPTLFIRRLFTHETFRVQLE